MAVKDISTEYTVNKCTLAKYIFKLFCSRGSQRQQEYHENVVIRDLDNDVPVDCADITQIDIVLYFDAPTKDGTKIIKSNDLENV